MSRTDHIIKVAIWPSTRTRPESIELPQQPSQKSNQLLCAIDGSLYIPTTFVQFEADRMNSHLSCSMYLIIFLFLVSTSMLHLLQDGDGWQATYYASIYIYLSGQITPTSLLHRWNDGLGFGVTFPKWLSTCLPFLLVNFHTMNHSDLTGVRRDNNRSRITIGSFWQTDWRSSDELGRVGALNN